MRAPDTTDEDSIRTRRATWERLLQHVAVLTIGVGVTVALARLAPPEPREPFARHFSAKLRRERPDYVLVGNSMVDTRFDEGELNRLLAPERASITSTGGSKSAYWYLLLKNSILSTLKPKRILIFYRRDELTAVRRNAIGPDKHRIDEVSHEREPVVEAKLAPPPGERMARLGYELERLAPFPRLHALVAPSVTAFAAFVSAGTFEAKREQRTLDSVFGVGKLRGADIEVKLAPVNAAVFKATVGGSLLPDIIELAKNAHVPLTMIRVRTHADAVGVEPEMDYQNALALYLVKNGVEVVDMSGARWESADLYGEGDHIAARYRQRYTRLFIEHLRGVFH